MAEEKLLTIRDVSLFLGISEKEVIDLAESGKVPAYKVGGVYLRFKREQIEEFRKSFKAAAHNNTASSKKHSFTQPLRARSGFKDTISDFFYFNDFYLLAILIIVLMLVIIFQRS